MGANNLRALQGFRRIADSVRRIPETLGQRPTLVTIRQRTYSGAIAAHGTTLLSAVDTVLDPRPRVVQTTAGQRSYFGGGTLMSNDGIGLATQYEIGPITQSFPGGGYTQSEVVRPDSTVVRTTVLLEGDEFSEGGEEFEITDSDFTRPQRGMLQVTRGRQGA